MLQWVFLRAEQKPILVVAGMVRRDRHILICQRERSDAYGLQWESPLNTLKEDESWHRRSSPTGRTLRVRFNGNSSMLVDARTLTVLEDGVVMVWRMKWGDGDGKTHAEDLNLKDRFFRGASAWE